MTTLAQDRNDSGPGVQRRIEVVVKKTRVGKLATIRDTAAESGLRGATDAENFILTEYKEKVNSVLDSLETDNAESGDVLGHFELTDDAAKWRPRSEEDSR